MKRLIYQVCLGKAMKSNLYSHCIQSVKQYCYRHDIEHIVLTYPKLMIKPDPFSTNRSEQSYKNHGGFLPIYEKENAFDLLDQYDQVAIIDADIYIRPDAPNIFDDFGMDRAFGAVCEREMNITPEYVNKIKNYSAMQYQSLHGKGGLDFDPNERGYRFFNMGMMLINSDLFLPYLRGQSAKKFLARQEFKQFVDGVGAWKWSTDQTLLNYFITKYDIPTKHMSDKWNALYTANTGVLGCHFVHFFLKDKLPMAGENVAELMKNV